MEMNFNDVLREDKNLRIDSEFFFKAYFATISKIKKHDIKTLNDITDKISDGTHFTPNYQEDGIPFLSAINIKTNYLDIAASYKFISNKEHQVLYKRCNPKPKDILLRKVGVGPRWACVIPDNIFEFSIFVSVAQIRCSEYVNPYYISTFINTNFGQIQLLRFNKGISQPDLHLEEIRKLKIPILDLSFQNEIEALVKNSHAKLEQSKSLYLEAETLLLRELGLENWQPPKETVAVKSFSESFGKAGRLDAEYYQPKYDEVINIATKNAKYCKKIAEIQVVNARGLQPNYIENGELSVINSRHILEQQLDYGNFEKTDISYWKSQERGRIFKNDILIYTTGANIGRTNVYLIEEKAMASNHVNILRIEAEKPIYVGFVLNSLIGRLQTEKLCTGSAQQELYPKDLEQFIIPFIDKVIQDKIANKVEENLSLKIKSKQLLELAKQAVETAIEQGEDKAVDMLKIIDIDRRQTCLLQ